MATKFLALGVAAWALSALPSHAAVTVTWTGTVFDGNDPANIFGVGPNNNPLGNLQGQAFSAQFRIDPAVGQVTTAADYLDVRGGTFTGAFPTPLLSATLTINGFAYSFGSGYFGGYQRDATPGRSAIYTEANQQQLPGVVDILAIYEFLPDNSIPYGGITESFTRTVTGPVTVGVFQAFATGTSTGLFSGHLTLASVTIAPDSPTNGGGSGGATTGTTTGGGAVVPEPSTGLLTMAAAGITLWLRRLRQRPV